MRCVPCASASPAAVTGGVMADGVRAMLLRLLRVPAEPAPPPGDPERLRTFRAAPSYLRYSIAAWVFKQAGAALGLLASYLFLQSFTRHVPFAYFGLMEQVFIAAFIAQLPFSFALVRLDFEMRWYMLTDRSLRIRHGIVRVNEQTMTFANVQNITIRQNPLQRLFGVSTVAVRAAGGGAAQSGSGGTGSGSHEATFEGVADAEAIRDLIRERIRRYRGAGTGDPDERDGPTLALPVAGGAAVASRAVAPGAAPAGTAPTAAVAATASVTAPAATTALTAAVAAADRLLDEMRRLSRALHAD
jgi:membrane protein YdbS with pleckstrin-like domain